MADIEATLGLNYEQFKRGLAESRREAENFAKFSTASLSKASDFIRSGLTIGIGMKVAHEGIRFAQEAMDAYANSTLDAAAQSSLLAYQTERSMVRIGAAIEDGPLGAMTKKGSQLQKWGLDLVESVQRLSGTKEYWAAFDANLESQEAAKRARDDRRNMLVFQGASAEASGHPADAARAAEELRHMDAMMKAGAKFNMMERGLAGGMEESLHALKMTHIAQEERATKQRYDTERGLAMALMDARELGLEGEDRAAKMAAVTASYNAQIKAAGLDLSIPPEERVRRQTALREEGMRGVALAGREFDMGERRSMDRFGFGREAVDIDIMATQGFKEAADLARISMDYAQREADLRENAGLSDMAKETQRLALLEDRDRLLRAHATQSQEDLDLLMQQKADGRNFRDIQAGFGGDRAGALLMSGRSEAEDTETQRLRERSEKLQEKMIELLQRGNEIASRSVAIAG